MQVVNAAFSGSAYDAQFIEGALGEKEMVAGVVGAKSWLRSCTWCGREPGGVSSWDGRRVALVGVVKERRIRSQWAGSLLGIGTEGPKVAREK